jgi:3',5'-cyclic AMP phosphodiesterase CpdA
MPHPTRRAALAAGLAAAPASQAQPRGFRFVYMPCIHFRPEWGAPEGLAQALATVERLSPRPDFIITGGDAVHDLRSMTYPTAEARLADFLRLWNAATTIPTHHMLGNHEIVGFSHPDAREADPLWGKALPMQAYGMAGPHQAFSHGGWRMVLLDNVQAPAKGRFFAEVQADGLAFLTTALAEAPAMPSIVFTHVPLLSATEFFGGWARLREGVWQLGSNRMSRDPRAVLDIAATADVKAFVSCHIHELERLTVARHHFICAGAVSGQMWNGPRTPGPLGTPEGFGVFDCRPDGSFDFTYQGFGWRTRNPNPPPPNRGAD